MKFLIPFFVIFSLNSFAAEEKTALDKFIDKHTNTTEKEPKKDQGLIDPAIDKAKDVTEEGKTKIESVAGTIIESKDLRDHSFGTVMLGFQPFSTWLPGKWTGSYTQNFSKYWVVEGEYSHADLSVPLFGIDLGSVTEERVSLHARYFPGNSFNMLFGLAYQKGKVELGSDIPKTPDVNFFEMENFALTLGLGNRWQMANGITFGVDWIRFNQPLFGQWENDAVLKHVSGGSARSIKRIINNFNTLPTFTVLGLSIGYTF
ncbi:MAG: hypothetical protein ACJ76H_15225 [Bacteriovoracaceae bacterium]